MKYAERLAQIAFFGLLIIAAGLVYAIVQYQTISFWAGALTVFSHALLVAFLWWGLRLARQQKELMDAGGPAAMAVAPDSGMGGLSASDENPAFANNPKDDNEVRTLETGFQRVVVVLAGLALLVVTGVIAWLVVGHIQSVKPGEVIAVSPVALDNGAVVAAIGALAGYIILFSITRNTPRTRGYGEALHGVFVMGLPASIAVAAAVTLGFFKYGYAGEVGAAVAGFFLALQGLELLFNAFRSYEGVEEFDQEAVDLQALPLVPMFSSQWILGLRILLGQSFGLAKSGDGEAGVFARVMPRVILAVVVVLIGSSMLRSVPTGTVAIRERLGYAGDDDISNPLQPGLHVVAPWPIDKLVVIPTAQLQSVTVGAEEMAPVINGKRQDFSLWTTRHTTNGEEMEYITGDQLLLGGYVGVWWRVSDASKFYRAVSHSDFYGGDKNDQQNQGRPIYESLIQDNATYAVIHTFGTHGLEDIMAAGRGAIQARCRQYLQERLDQIGSGIEIVDLTIKDVHPPQAVNEEDTANGKVFGPARAYEEVENSREYREAQIDLGQARRIGAINQSKGEAAKVVNTATGDAAQTVNTAIGATAYISTVAQNISGHEDIAEERMLYNTMAEVFPSVNKIVIGDNVKRPQVIQAGSAGVNGAVIPVSPGR